jgi:hypothetical protein
LFDLNLQLEDWPMTKSFGFAEVVRGFRGIDTFKMTEFEATGLIFLENSVDSADFSRKMNP